MKGDAIVRAHASASETARRSEIPNSGLRQRDALARLCTFAMSGLHPKVLQGLQEQSSNPPLWNACFAGQSSSVRQLLASGVDINQPGGRGSTPLAAAAKNGHASICSILCSAGADINAGSKFDQTTPLMVAATFDHNDVIQVLVKQRGSIDPFLEVRRTKMSFYRPRCCRGQDYYLRGEDFCSFRLLRFCFLIFRERSVEAVLQLPPSSGLRCCATYLHTSCTPVSLLSLLCLSSL